MNVQNPRPRAFIQAGGYSSRMGRDKSWIEIDGRPMIDSVLATAQSVADHISIIISKDTPGTDRYQSAAEGRGAGLIFDRHEHKGPLGGIDTALSQCRPGETALILACDLPFLSPRFLGLLADIHFNEGNDVTVPVDREGRVQMLSGLYSISCLAPVERLLAEDMLKVDRICAEVECRRVNFTDYEHLDGAGSFLSNINSEAEYLAVLQGTDRR